VNQRTMGGFALVLVGMVGLVVPVLPGWIFLIPGLAILAERYHWANRLIVWVKQKAKTSRFQ